MAKPYNDLVGVFPAYILPPLIIVVIFTLGIYEFAVKRGWIRHTPVNMLIGCPAIIGILVGWSALSADGGILILLISASIIAYLVLTRKR